MIDIFTADDVVSRYTRAEAIDDGVLVDVSTQARAVGLRYPVAMTAAAFDRCVTWSANDARRHGEQSEIIRLARVLTALRHAARRASGDRIDFDILAACKVRGVSEKVDLIAECGPGDLMEPVITIMLPGED